MPIYDLQVENAQLIYESGDCFSAIELLNEALKANPKSELGWKTLVNAYRSMGDTRAAYAANVNWSLYCPLSFDAKISEFSASLNVADWSRYSSLNKFIVSAILKGAYFVGESILTSPYFTNEIQALCMDRYSNGLRKDPIRPSFRGRKNSRKLRVGFLGKDFAQHSTNYLLIGVIESHNKDKFEFIAYDYNENNVDGDLRDRALSAYEQFHDVSAYSNIEIAQLIARDGLDILLYMQSVADPRFEVLAYRPAPRQIGYLYYPGIANAVFVDAIIADDMVVPSDLERFYKKVYKLSGCYQPNDGRRYIPELNQGVARTDKNFIFANFSAAHKINPKSIQLWSQIILACEESVLLLIDYGVYFKENITSELLTCGVDPMRIRFVSQMDINEHLNRLSSVDLVLDTYPYGSHTGTSDALWSGTPILSLRGEQFASRVAGSLLHSCQLDEFIVDNEHAFVAKAISLYGNRSLIEKVKQYLVANRSSFSLFDTLTYTKNFETLLEEIAQS